MNRRKFLGLLGSGVAAAAAVRSWPFRVFSFPEEVKLATPAETIRFITAYYPAQERIIDRWDVLVGFGALYPDAAVRIIGMDDDGDPVENTLRGFEILDGAEQGILAGSEGPTSDWQVLRLQKGHQRNGVVRLLS